MGKFRVSKESELTTFNFCCFRARGSISESISTISFAIIYRRRGDQKFQRGSFYFRIPVVSEIYVTGVQIF